MKQNSVLALIFFLLISWVGISTAAPKRPLIFLPGILGSKLYLSQDNVYDDTDELLWGDRSSYRKFTRLRLHDKDQIIPHGIIESINVLGPWKVKQYTQLISHLENLGYRRGEDLFLFSYDWRKSNFNSAKLLNSFIESCKQTGSKCQILGEGKFDVVAHSMGGLVARIFMDRYPFNGRRIENLITLGTPFRGSHAVVESIISGFSGLTSILSGNQDEVRTVMLSFESGFELSPTYRDCCFVGETWGQALPLDIGIADSWLKFIPSGQSASDWRRHINLGLQRREQIFSIVNSSSDNSTIYPVASSNIRTKSQLLYKPDSREVDWSYSRGDGTVPLVSASNLKASLARVSMNKHSHIFDDQYVEETLRRVLIDDNHIVPFAIEFLPCRSNKSEQCYLVGDVLTKGANVEMQPAITIVNEPVNVSFVVQPDLPMLDGTAISARVCISDAYCKKATCIIDRLMSLAPGDNGEILSYYAPAFLDREGDFKATVFVNDNEIMAEYFSVIGVQI